MLNGLAALTAMRRPRLLIRAARHGLDEYRRDRTLPRLITDHRQLSPVQTLERLMTAEAEIETERAEGRATYSVTAHIEVLIALMAEARLAVRSGQTA